MNTQEQKHPQYNSDHATVKSLIADQPTDFNLVELARLKIRYRGFPGARDIQSDLEKILQNWQLTEETLFEKTREIHAKGQVYKVKKEDQEDWL
ncbi:DUF3288 family protein [Limnoraphis robusta]|uniref:DUF3288 domain-containing protein n=1 Tax=Limnoraphis robusta CS-951 TaxID=1637645 RepID=A0A0F5Y9X3_9CYAN|nr:DUF3288 family protein [Limnoraphis robusta]KKD35721.1 hypothetical protein WN50_23775 [Limnoraphis robusta CS-951]KMW70986.1 hypothetical protein WN50_31190 [Limnoraphis robusta CS-951]